MYGLSASIIMYQRDYDVQSRQSGPGYTMKRYVMPSRRDSEYQTVRRRSVDRDLLPPHYHDYEYALETDFDRELYICQYTSSAFLIILYLVFSLFPFPFILPHNHLSSHTIRPKWIQLLTELNLQPSILHIRLHMMMSTNTK